jgi:hypothetical protein
MVCIVEVFVVWHTIQHEADIAVLMDRFNHFHDSIVREVHCWSDYWAPPEDANDFGSTAEQLSHVRILFQRWDSDPVAIEMLFSGVTHFKWRPTQPNHVPDIDQASITIIDDLIYWVDHWEWDPGDDQAAYSTWVIAATARWREVDSWGGRPLRYGTVPDIIAEEQ